MLLECPYRRRTLHVAGNDANMTLRALLIAIVDVTGKQLPDPDHAQKRLLLALESIARAPMSLSDRQKGVERRRRQKEESQARKKEAKHLPRWNGQGEREEDQDLDRDGNEEERTAQAPSDENAESKI